VRIPVPARHAPPWPFVVAPLSADALDTPASPPGHGTVS
jgi:hypothetical protein